MFLDPEPKRQRHSMSASPFFSAQAPVSAGERRAIKRKPLQQRTQSENNRQSPERSNQDKSTVRLVNPTPSPSAQRAPDNAGDISTASTAATGECTDHFENAPPHPPTRNRAREASATKPGFAPPHADQRVSELLPSTNEVPKLDQLPRITLLPEPSSHGGPQAASHRRCGSSGNYSTSSTLKEPDSQLVRDNRSERLSSGTTLRGTPTPSDPEHGERTRTRDSSEQGAASALQILQETPPERVTIRAVPRSIESSPSRHNLGFGPPESSFTRPQTAPSSDSDRAPEALPSRSSRRATSTGSIPISLRHRKLSNSRAPRHQASHDSIAGSEATLPSQSSPNVVAYYSDSSRPRSRSQPLEHTSSPEAYQAYHPRRGSVRDAGQSLTNSSSWASLQPASSNDTLPSLRIPKKRLRHKPKSLSLGSQSNFASRTGGMDASEIDTFPYPRQAFSSHLSTIASESDRSRTASQQLSHFSLGSGVLTGDDSSSIPLSGAWPRRRRESEPIESMASGSSPRGAPGGEEEPGDMTLGLYREESAKPQPLFKKRSPSAPGEDRIYEDRLVPIPPIPRTRDSDEHFDRLSELQSPGLRPKRSGYSLRQRSNSTPSQGHSRQISQVSYVESDRWSDASSIFPTWAKSFYRGDAQLLSASKISLHSQDRPREQQSRQPTRARSDSQWTDRTTASRLGTGYSNMSGGSSHFLPSIFRPRTHGKTVDGTSRSSKIRRSKRSRPSGDADDRPDSLAIFVATPPQGANDDTLASGQPKFGPLKDEPESRHRPLPRKYSKQKQWDEMTFPRPMTKDRLSDFGMHEPHLGPSKRTSHRLSAWRPPSLVESLDQLICSRYKRQVLLFALGFVCPLLWMLAAVLPLPKRPVSSAKNVHGSEDDVQAAMMEHEAGDAEKRWQEEKQWLKARWWRTLNRIMSLVGVLVIGAVIALAVVATR